MAYPVMPLGFLGSQGDNDTYRIERSLRFNSADSAYLSRTPASAGNRKTWTWSGWVKRSGLGTNQGIFTTNGSTDTTLFSMRFSSSDTLIIAKWSIQYLITTQVFRDVSSWFHLVVAFNTSASTSSDRIKLYINGSQVTSFSTTNYPAQNDDTGVTDARQHQLGSEWNVTDFLSGYLSEVYLIDGQALTPSSFGETDALTGRWKAKAYSGTYGTNGFYLKFADNSGTTATTLGKDSSGNGNNWTPNNFSVTAGAGNDSLVDSPTNYGTDTGVGGEVRGNYCTLNPLAKGSAITLANGNLDLTQTSTWNGVIGTMAVSSGKWYWELTYGGGTACVVGVATNSYDISTEAGIASTAWRYRSDDGTKRNGGAGSSSYGATWTTNDVIGIALNMDSGEITFYKNNASQGVAYSNLSGNTVFPVVGIFGSSGATSLNFGQRLFAYTAPAGFKALCTTNLPTPTIKKPSSYMDVVTWTGDGTSSRTITGLNFQPELIWIKNRTNAYNHTVVDSVRGGSLYLETNNTNIDQSATVVSSFNSNGFQIGTSSIQVNGTSNTYVAWAWDEAPIAGMDIVSYTGNGTTQNVSHALGVKPAFIISKNRTNGTGNNWGVYHKSLTSSQYIYLNLTNAASSSGANTAWGNNTSTVEPTSSVFTVGNSTAWNENSSLFIAYLFAEVEGFSKFGSYTGNGSSDGPFVWCGFRPKFLFTKRTDSGVTNWQLVDSARFQTNECGGPLYPNLSNSEAGSSNVDLLSNGFKARANNGDLNASGGTYIFCAFAESAYKYSRAR